MTRPAVRNLLLGGPTWIRIRSVKVNAGTTPWDFSSVDLSGAGSTATMNSAAPVPYEGAGYITFACDGSDGANGRARAQIEPPYWNQGWKYIRVRFAVFLPTGFSTSVAALGSAQVWKFDCFPTTNNQVFLLYYQGDNTHKLVVKDNNVDSDITNTFTIAENGWHLIEIQMRLSSGSNGWARVWQDGALVASGYGVKTIYGPDNGSGHKIPYVRYGLAAHGVGQLLPTTANIDDASLDFA